jgi:hypothetical protein
LFALFLKAIGITHRLFATGRDKRYSATGQACDNGPTILSLMENCIWKG